MHLNGRQRYSFGLFGVLLAMAAFSVTFAGCAKSRSIGYSPSGTVVVPTDSATIVKYLALGDSYTIGQSVPESGRFPVQLAEKLSTGGIKMAIPKLIAATGWTTQNLLSAVETQRPAEDFDLVTLLIGVNNQYQQRDTFGYRAQFQLCLKTALTHANGRKNRVFVLSIPDYSVTAFGQRDNPALISGQIDQYNAINKAVTDEFGISYTDITAVSRLALTNKGLTAADGLHPSGQQYALWMNLLAPKIMAVLK